MKNRANKPEQLKVYLRDNSPSHKNLKRRCDHRNREKYKTAADYLAAAVEKLESGDVITFTVDLNNLNDEAYAACETLLKYKLEIGG